MAVVVFSTCSGVSDFGVFGVEIKDTNVPRRGEIRTEFSGPNSILYSKYLQAPPLRYGILRSLNALDAVDAG